MSEKSEKSKQLEKMNEKEDKKSCFRKIQESKVRNNGININFCGDVIIILLKSCVSLIIFMLNNAIGLTSLAIGIIFIDDCPVRPLIPVILIVYGVLCMMNGVIFEWIRWEWLDMEDNESICTGLAKSILCSTLMAIFITFIIACVTIYGIAFPNFDKSSGDKYCNEILYLIAFIIITLYWAIVIFCILMICCIGYCVVFSAGVVAANEAQE